MSIYLNSGVSTSSHSEYLIIFGLVVAIIILITLFIIIYFKHRRHSEQMIQQTQDKLHENYKELESAYQIVSATQKKLYQKYEELKVSEDRNRKLAYTDALTELPNRNAFNEQLEEKLSMMSEDDKMAILFIDIDNFKNINDTLGHSYGDELLIDVTHRIMQAIEPTDFLARFGGDEFIVLTDKFDDLSKYEDKIKRIQNVFSYPYILASKEFFVTVSMGICIAPDDGNNVQSLLKNVDSAMYTAKEQGKNMYCYYNESMNDRLMELIETQSELRTAIDKQQFVLYYQAQVDLDSNRVVGFEALVRWNHPEKGILYPGDFIQIAEDTGLIVPLGNWIMLEACKQLKEWQDLGHHDVNMAVNFSARQFMDVDIVQMVKETIEKTKIDPINLEIEITESIALKNIEYSIETIQQLRKMGIQVSLDDFGTGYSSMSYLKLLPVSNLKIDKSFLDTVMENKSDQKIVSAIISLAQALNLAVIAEGVEEKEQASFLKEVHCNKAQGYLYSKPIPNMDAQKYLDYHFDGLKDAEK